MSDDKSNVADIFVNANANGRVLFCEEGLSFWGGVDPNTGKIIDTHHSNYGQKVSGKIMLMECSRGSCSGSGVLVQLARSGLAPAAIVFCEPEQTLTLGAIISDRLFDSPVAIIRLNQGLYTELANSEVAEIRDSNLYFSHKKITLKRPNLERLKLTRNESQMLIGEEGPAKKIAMEIICLMAAIQDASELLEVSRAHIDGCILSQDANLDFAEKMYQIGAVVCIPTTINAISVDRENWRAYGQSCHFGLKASRLADAYVKMGAQPTFTCAPYLLSDSPSYGDVIAWSESNAVIFANSVLGAWTEKHPDFLDFFIACTGRAPKCGVYLSKNRIPGCEIKVVLPVNFKESLWPMLGWLTGVKSSKSIPILTGLELTQPSQEDLKAFSAAFGATSSAPMFYIRGHSPDSPDLTFEKFNKFEIKLSDFQDLWAKFNEGSNQIDLVAIGSPHASLKECEQFAELLRGRQCAKHTQAIVTVSRDTLKKMKNSGVSEKLIRSGVQIIPDICWCSMTEPVFPVRAAVVITNSGKYAYYGRALTGREFRFGGLQECAKAAIDGEVNLTLPNWLL